MLSCLLIFLKNKHRCKPGKLMNDWEKKFQKILTNTSLASDPAHDFLHVKRVVEIAKQLSSNDGGLLEIILPAAWFHDLVIIPKNGADRKNASKLSAQKAIEYLREIEYSSVHLEQIAHAIEAHSFSANIDPQTIEAKIVQDADRLDGLGAIGVARCFSTAGLIQRQFYAEEDPFCHQRAPDDSKFTIDHFYKKLLKTAETLKTKSGIKEGARRAVFMRDYLNELERELYK